MNGTITSLVFLVLAQATVLAQPVVEVLRPNSSDRLQRGTTFRIEWRTQGFSANIDWSFVLYTNDVRFRFVFAQSVDDGGGNWHADLTVPSDLPSGCNYTLNINDDVSEANDDSEVFCLGVPVVSLSASPLQGKGDLRVEGVFSNGVCTVEHAGRLTDSWRAVKNFFTLSNVVQ